MSNIGIDVSKMQLQVAVRPGELRFSVRNDEEGFKELAERLRKLQPERIVMEPTGGYELAALQLSLGLNFRSSSSTHDRYVSLPRR